MACHTYDKQSMLVVQPAMPAPPPPPAKMNQMLYTAELMIAASWGLGLIATAISP